MSDSRLVAVSDLTMPRIRSLQRKFGKSLATRGIGGTITFAAQFAWKSVHNLRSNNCRSGPEWDAQDEEFDQLYGVDTAGVVPLSDLNIDNDSWIFGSQYQAIGSHVHFTEILNSLEVPYDEFVFIDLGSGKGRAVLKASLIPFKKIVGVEFSAELHRTAENNLHRWPGDKQKCKEIELLCMDAGNYRLPDEPFVLYMYNPFGRPVMQRVIENVVATFLERPRRIIVLYFTPRATELWEEVDFLKIIQSGPGYVVLDVRTINR